MTDLKWENGELIGDEDISEWLQEILPQIKERYHGKIACGGGAWGGSSPEAWKLVLDNCDIDFTGYDYIGFAPYRWHLTPKDLRGMVDDPTVEQYREYIRYSLTTLNKWAERDGFAPQPDSKADDHLPGWVREAITNEIRGFVDNPPSIS